MGKTTTMINSRGTVRCAQGCFGCGGPGYAEKYEKLGTLLDRLPLELLSHIFLFAKDNFPSFLEPKSSLRTSPFNVSQVCSKWRKLAVNTPSLWCAISFTSGPEEAFQQLESLIRPFWLPRCQFHPLAIHVSDESTTGKCA